MQKCFRRGVVHTNANKTFIVLIPKVEHAANFNQFRPIILCNFYYKVIAKIVANKLSKVMAKIISPNPGAFVRGRWIAENTIVAHELIHKIKKHKGRKMLLLMKIDLKKAFDRLEWRFLNTILKALGVNENFRDLVHNHQHTPSEWECHGFY